MESKEKSKLTLTALILMIFTSVYGFTNMPRTFYLMGYSGIIWYIMSAILFFIPYAFMMAEYGAAFRKEKGGILSKQINQNLQELEMKNAKVNICVEYQPEFFENGKDKVNINFTTNVGEEEKELSKIASGGEMSRIMLAIKTVIANTD